MKSHDLGDKESEGHDIKVLMGRSLKLFAFFLGVISALIAAFWPRPLGSATLTFRVPFYKWSSDLGRGNLVPLSTLVPLRTDIEQNILRPEAVWFPFHERTELAIVIPGLGGEASHDLNFLMAESFISKGIPTVILPNPTAWAFAIHRMQKNQRAQYANSVEALCSVYDEFIASPRIKMIYNHHKPSHIYLVGLSLGARYAIAMTSCSAFNSISSSEQPELRVYAVNPPTDLKYAGQVLDRLAKEFQESRIESYLTGILITVLKPVAQATNIDLALRPLTFFSESLYSLLGASFSASMERIDTEQAASFTGLELRSKDFSFSKYMEQGPTSLKGFLQEINLAQKRTRGQLYLLHSKDDFLIRQNDLDQVSKILKEKATLLEQGGHGGLIFEPVYKEIADRVISL